ncbi:MAG: hypothetical protein IPI66_12325 [Chitinophagaceae bacterium]|nr:hypothetical protein [Chitinophagaceae bacterium]MBL0056349.1 hypothetical protein [Chitinophagaceae bacterium]
MNFIKKWIYLPLGLGIILLTFVIASLFDIVIAVMNPRFYSTAAFITVFGVAGIFAAVFCYVKAIERATVKNEFARWSIIILMVITGLLFFFPLAALEGGEYEAAFKSFGVTLALASFIFVKGKVDF